MSMGAGRRGLNIIIKGRRFRALFAGLPILEDKSFEPLQDTALF
jgi:hypothetical protein